MFLKWVVHQSAVSRCYAIFCVHNFEVYGLTWKKCGSNKVRATAHTARVSMTVFWQMFPQHVVSRFGDVPWPPRSPDLSACDFFLWGYLKSKVYIRKPRTVEGLKVSIREKNCNCATRNVSKCDAELWGEAPDVCMARTPSFRYNFP